MKTIMFFLFTFIIFGIKKGRKAQFKIVGSETVSLADKSSIRGTVSETWCRRPQPTRATRPL